MQKLLGKENITVRTSEPYTPTHNGLAERFNRELQEKNACTLV